MSTELHNLHHTVFIVLPGAQFSFIIIEVIGSLEAHSRAGVFDNLERLITDSRCKKKKEVYPHGLKTGNLNVRDVNLKNNLIYKYLNLYY